MSALRRLLRRRERVVPVVPRARRRQWERAAPDDPAARLHLLYLRHRDDFLPGYFASFDAYPVPRNRLARAWRWYAGDVLAQSARQLRRNGRLVRRIAGVPLTRQLRQLLWLSVSLPSMPENYYKYELFRPANRARAGEYLHRHETKGGLYLMLATVDDLAEVAPLNDKLAFTRRAAAAGLETVPVLAVVEPGARATGELPAADLFVKPRSGKGGRGAERWTYLPDQDSFRSRGQDGAAAPIEVSRDRLLKALVGRTAGQPVVVQPALVNHPELADLALDAVATCRVITILDEAGAPEPVIAIFRMPAVPGVVVDNLHRGGVAAPVEIGSGELGAAAGYATAAARHTRHPVSGGLIAGRKLPSWDQVLDLAVRAHAAFPPRVLVGWDICIGPSGPVLVEGNEQPGVDGLQRLHDVPLGSHRFGALLAYHFSAASPPPEPARWPSAARRSVAGGAAAPDIMRR
jgi:hypothetical protein